jgi:hypothetical protein
VHAAAGWLLPAWLALVAGTVVRADPPSSSPAVPPPPILPVPASAPAPAPATGRGAPKSRVVSQGPTLKPPYLLTLENIVRLTYLKNPTVRAAREEMRAAKHALEEFRANLNRLEPYVELRSDLSRFPNRQGAFGDAIESVVGVQKESFEGSILKTEVGASYSYFDFNKALVTGDSTETRASTILRTRVEVPFLGSRRRQDRIIAQAYQESTARKAQLDYLKNYRTLVENALSYYNLMVYYRRLADTYATWSSDLDRLMKDPRLKPHDKGRVESVRASSESYRGQYGAREKEYLTILMGFIGVESEHEVQVELPVYQLSSLLETARTADGLKQLTDRARANNPTFRVLEDAIHNVELQHTQAIRGKFDVTTFMEGTLFPVGSERFDDRYNGWTVGAGVNVRLNDHRVRDATRLKAEAQIRQFRAEIEAEEINMRRKINSTTKAIWDNDDNRRQMLEVGKRKAEEYALRQADYFTGALNIDQLLGTRADIVSNGANLANIVYNTADREATLLLALGKVYELVGLRFGEDEEADEPPLRSEPRPPSPAPGAATPPR